MEPEAHQADLPAVGVARQGQVDFAGRDVVEALGIVQKKQTQVAGATGVTRQQALQMRAPVPSHPVAPYDLHRAGRGFGQGLRIHQQLDAVRG